MNTYIMYTSMYIRIHVRESRGTWESKSARTCAHKWARESERVSERAREGVRGEKKLQTRDLFPTAAAILVYTWRIVSGVPSKMRNRISVLLDKNAVIEPVKAETSTSTCIVSVVYVYECDCVHAFVRERKSKKAWICVHACVITWKIVRGTVYAVWS